MGSVVNFPTVTFPQPEFFKLPDDLRSTFPSREGVLEAFSGQGCFISQDMYKLMQELAWPIPDRVQFRCAVASVSDIHATFDRKSGGLITVQVDTGHDRLVQAARFKQLEPLSWNTLVCFSMFMRRHADLFARARSLTPVGLNIRHRQVLWRPKFTYHENCLMLHCEKDATSTLSPETLCLLAAR